MDEKDKTITIDDAVGALLSDLPKAIRDFVQGPERDRIALELTKKYSLHLDQGGTFQLAYMQMLLGAISPEEFRTTLVAAGISSETVTGLMNDVNEMVFKPLREKEREATDTPPAPPLQPLPTPPIPATPAVASVPPPTPPMVPPPPASPIPSPTPTAPKPIPAAPNNLPTEQTRTPVPGNLPPFPFPPEGPAKRIVPEQPETTAPEPPASSPFPPAPAPRLMPPEKRAEAALPEQRALEASAFVPMSPQSDSFVPPPPAEPINPTSVNGSMRTMQSDMLAANEHREAAPVEFHPSAPPVQPVAVTREQVVAPPPLPHATASVLGSSPASAPARPQVTGVSAVAGEPPAPVSYTSSDPYREPIG